MWISKYYCTQNGITWGYIVITSAFISKRKKKFINLQKQNDIFSYNEKITKKGKKSVPKVLFSEAFNGM